MSRDGKQHGPLSEAEMQRLVDGRHLRPGDLVWRTGLESWKPLAEVPELQPLSAALTALTVPIVAQLAPLPTATDSALLSRERSAIFINYRRGDDPGYTQALYQRLEDEFTADRLFMDVEGHIKPGDDFVDVLNRQVAASDVLLVVIGPRWAGLLAARQADPDDFVVIEIRSALDKGKRVIPVLVGGAGMPRAETLPEPIRALARRNAVGLRPERFRSDCQGLVTALKENLAAAATERAARSETERLTAEAARREADAQVATRARATEERGRAQAAAGLSPDEIRKAEELANWQFIEARRDIADLRDHLARFPAGVTERYAQANLEELVWGSVSTTPTLATLRSFLDEFPKGANATSARAQLAQLQKEASDAAVADQRRLKETEAWGAVAAGTDQAAIEAFVKAWPDGRHLKAASARLLELRSTGEQSDPIWIGVAAGWAMASLPIAIATAVLSQRWRWPFPDISLDFHLAAGFLCGAGLVVVFAVGILISRAKALTGTEAALYWLGAASLAPPSSLFLFVAFASFNGLDRSNGMAENGAIFTSAVVVGSAAMVIARRWTRLQGPEIALYWLGCAYALAAGLAAARLGRLLKEGDVFWGGALILLAVTTAATFALRRGRQLNGLELAILWAGIAGPGLVAAMITNKMTNLWGWTALTALLGIALLLLHRWLRRTTN